MRLKPLLTHGALWHIVCTFWLSVPVLSTRSLVAGITLVAFQIRTDDASSREGVDDALSEEFIRGDANDDNRVDVSDV